MAGEIGRADFGKRLAQEWASFPVLVETKGATRQVARGQSYYAGDGVNKALVRPEEVESVLDEMLSIGSAMPAPVAVPEPRPEASAEAPAAIGHNGGPPLVAPEPAMRPNLSPLEQANKPIGGAKLGTGVTMPVGAALAIMLQSAGWLPEGWQSGVGATAFGVFTGWLFTQAGNLIGGYLAPDKRFQSGA